MGAAVIRHLRQFGDLPDKGIVAGQAVSSAIQDLFGDGRGQVYNDVDIFRELKFTETMRSRRKNTFNETVEQTTSHLPAPPKQEYGGLEAYLRKIRSYQLSSVSSHGKLNYVNCVVPGLTLGNTRLTGRRVIDSFDLNCTRAAVDLETGLLSWDRHFERFLATRQLEIAAVHTPWHTLLRLLKKAEELPDVYVDLQTSAEICAAVAHGLHASSFVHYGVVSTLFGNKAHELAEKTRSQWQGYFDLSQTTATARDGTKGQLYSMTPRGDASPEFSGIVDALSGAAIHYAPERMYGSRRKLSAKTEKKIVQVQQWAEKHDCPQVSYLLSVRHDAFVTGQVSESHVTQIGAVLKKHDGLKKLLSPMTLEQQLEVVTVLRKSADEHGQWVYGVFETDRSIVGVPSIAEMKAMLDKHIEEKLVPFDVRPLALDCLPRDWTRAGIHVEELLTGAALDEEGDSLSHCVGGYAGHVRSNLSRIIRIRTGEHRADWSTIEVSKRGKLELGPQARLSLVQHRGFANKEPSQLNKEVVAYLLSMHGKTPLQRVLSRVGAPEHIGKLFLKLSRAARNAARKFEDLGQAQRKLSMEAREVNHELLRQAVVARLGQRFGDAYLQAPPALAAPQTQD
ncbi:hypothetical protein AS149_13200 [Burkholderia cenocepacia]|nr:hypothetical protein AS149_13200 [Burkholderia cenocepacia]